MRFPCGSMQRDYVVVFINRRKTGSSRHPARLVKKPPLLSLPSKRVCACSSLWFGLLQCSSRRLSRRYRIAIMMLAPRSWGWPPLWEV